MTERLKTTQREQIAGAVQAKGLDEPLSVMHEKTEKATETVFGYAEALLQGTTVLSSHGGVASISYDDKPTYLSRMNRKTVSYCGKCVRPF